MQDKVKVTLNGEEYEIGKITLRRIPEVAMSLNSFPELVKMMMSDDVSDIDYTGIIAKLPDILAKTGEQLPLFLAVVTEIDREKVLDFGIDDLVYVIDAIFAVNNFKVIWPYVKNLLAAQPQQQVQAAQAQAE